MSQKWDHPEFLNNADKFNNFSKSFQITHSDPFEIPQTIFYHFWQNSLQLINSTQQYMFWA